MYLSILYPYGSRPGRVIPNTIIKMVKTASLHCTHWEHALKRFPGINRKNRVLYPGTAFKSSATWPYLPKTHYNGLI